MSRWLSTSWLAFALILPEMAQACSVCVGPGFPQRVVNAYIVITILLSAMPLVFIGGLVWFYKCRTRN